MKPILYIVIPCFNEESVLPITAPMFTKKLEELALRDLISANSRVLFVNDGSSDNTWNIIKELSLSDKRIEGISLSRNRGHQNALMAGLADQGKAIIMISSEMPELMGMSDRMMVMHEGKIVGELQKEEFSQDRIMGMLVGEK